MEMHQVRYFLAVARLLNFTRAAEACNVSQPSLTRAIQKLEDELGGPLFHRERALTQLSALGRSMHPHLSQILAAAEAARQEAKDFGAARVAPLNIGIATFIDCAELHTVFAEISERLPGLQLGLRVGTSEDLIEALFQGQLELAVITRPDDLPDRVDTWTLFQRRLCVVTRTTHRLANRPEINLADLQEETLIHCGDDGSSLFQRTVERRGQTAAFRHNVSSFEHAHGLISAGLGCAVSPALRTLPPDLSAVLFDDTMPTLDITLAAMSGRRRSPAVEAFIRAARAREWTDH